jgi:hypothetical protein
VTPVLIFILFSPLEMQLHPFLKFRF